MRWGDHVIVVTTSQRAPAQLSVGTGCQLLPAPLSWSLMMECPVVTAGYQDRVAMRENENYLDNYVTNAKRLIARDFWSQAISWCNMIVPSSTLSVCLISVIYSVAMVACLGCLEREKCGSGVGRPRSSVCANMLLSLHYSVVARQPRSEDVTGPCSRPLETARTK